MPRLDLTNAVVVHIMENGEVESMSSSTARIIIVDERVGEEYEVQNGIDKPSFLREFLGENADFMPVKNQGVDDEPQARPELKLVE